WEVVSSYQYSGVGTGVAVTGVSVSPTSLNLSAGQTGSITATVSPANATNKGVTWSSSNVSVATVNASGQVSAVNAGTATITATTSEGARTATASITVSSGSGGLNYQFYTGTWSTLPNFSSLTPSKTGTVANFDLSPRTQNDNFAFRFTGNISIATAGAYTFFTTSDDGSKLYIDGTQVVNNDGLHGMVEASGNITLTAGSHTIEATIFEAGGGEGLEVRYQGPGIAKQLVPNSLFSTSIAVTGVSVSPATVSVMIGKTTQLTSTVAPADATNKNVTWTSSNNSIATVNASGLVSGVAEGTATITATTANGNKTSSSVVTVFANSKPTAVLNASVTTGNAPLTVTFNTNGSSDPNSGDFILGYDWDFGDGSPKEVSNAPSHTFNSVGNYTVTLRVMDNNNLYSDPVTKVINVSSGAAQVGGTLATWDFTGKGGQSTVAASSKLGDVTSASATIGAGLSALDYLSHGLTASDNTSTTLAQAISGNDYISFTVNPASGKALSITSVEIRPISQDAIRTFALFSSKNGFSAGNQISTFTSESQFGAALVSIAISNHVSLTTSTEFRVYIYGGGNQYQSQGFGNRTNAAGTYDLAILGTSSSTTTPPSGGPAGYTLCSAEGQSCVLTGTMDVAYGANGAFNYLTNRTGTINCNNATFGDPIVGVGKSCYVKSVSVATGTVTRETWTGISGTAISQIPISTSPNATTSVTSLEIPVNNGDNYGTRIRGYIIPSTSGSYTFYVSGDDDVELWLSTNNATTNTSRIAYINGWTNSREWNKFASQTSTPISLTAGQQYYFQVLHKEGGGGDNLAVGWTGPGISTISIIGGSNIAPFSGTTTPPTDTQAPSVPSGLTASNIAQTSFTLNWSASTDQGGSGLAGYEVYRGSTLVASPSGTSANITGLTAGTSYAMTVKAKDGAGNISASSAVLNVTTSNNTTPPSGTPKLPIGMNINSTNYYTKGLIYTDIMKAASSMFTFYDGGPWNSEQINNIPKDVNGYPTQIPYNTAGQNQLVRFLVNNYYVGKYVVLYDGAGQLRVNGLTNNVVGGKLYIDFNGQGGNIWIDILQSQSGNHIRNIRIVPEQYASGGAVPTFLPKFVDGLRPFHALRFMDWTSTNNSPQKNWSDRCTKTYYSQCTEKGMSIEYAIELANLVNEHAWFCVPHMASDDYQKQMARLIRDNLNANLKVYIEYSNEIWNWQFSQATWIINNAPGSVDSYVPTGLAAIDPNSGTHPEKDAYMMARTFRLFKGEFTGANATRLIKVAAVQHSWMDNTRRVLEYLKNNNQQCDLVSPGGYFNFEETQHNLWNTQCSAVTAAQVVAGADAEYAAGSQYWTRETAKYANQYGVGYAVYEGGQHMQPWQQGDWCYNQAVWDAQIHPAMYDLYMKNFATHVEPAVNCQLFMAFSYIGERQSKYGSWGHLESLDQVGNSNMKTIAPKYQALLDANSPKNNGRQERSDANNVSSTDNLVVYPNPANTELNISGITEESKIELINFSGAVISSTYSSDINYKLALQEVPNGIYLLRITTANQGAIVRKIVKE
ncbi:MAG: Ig-like domain-containing protein, partial [Bacteroidota bacterium]|nr:Ig-like domain-containing protein [Bacteroidota bacterium]